MEDLDPAILRDIEMYKRAQSMTGSPVLAAKTVPPSIPTVASSGLSPQDLGELGLSPELLQEANKMLHPEADKGAYQKMKDYVTTASPSQLGGDIGAAVGNYKGGVTGALAGGKIGAKISPYAILPASLVGAVAGQTIGGAVEGAGGAVAGSLLPKSWKDAKQIAQHYITPIYNNIGPVLNKASEYSSTPYGAPIPQELSSSPVPIPDLPNDWPPPAKEINDVFWQGLEKGARLGVDPNQVLLTPFLSGGLRGKTVSKLLDRPESIPRSVLDRNLEWVGRATGGIPNVRPSDTLQIPGVNKPVTMAEAAHTFRDLTGGEDNLIYAFLSNNYFVRSVSTWLSSLPDPFARKLKQQIAKIESLTENLYGGKAAGGSGDFTLYDRIKSLEKNGKTFSQRPTQGKLDVADNFVEQFGYLQKELRNVSNSIVDVMRKEGINPNPQLPIPAVKGWPNSVLSSHWEPLPNFTTTWKQLEQINPTEGLKKPWMKMLEERKPALYNQIRESLDTSGRIFLPMTELRQIRTDLGEIGKEMSISGKSSPFVTELTAAMDKDVVGPLAAKYPHTAQIWSPYNEWYKSQDLLTGGRLKDFIGEGKTFQKGIGDDIDPLKSLFADNPHALENLDKYRTGNYKDISSGIGKPTVGDVASDVRKLKFDTLIKDSFRGGEFDNTSWIEAVQKMDPQVKASLVKGATIEETAKNVRNLDTMSALLARMNKTGLFNIKSGLRVGIIAPIVGGSAYAAYAMANDDRVTPYAWIISAGVLTGGITFLSRVVSSPTLMKHAIDGYSIGNKRLAILSALQFGKESGALDSWNKYVGAYADWAKQKGVEMGQNVDEFLSAVPPTPALLQSQKNVPIESPQEGTVPLETSPNKEEWASKFFVPQTPSNNKEEWAEQFFK